MTGPIRDDAAALGGATRHRDSQRSGQHHHPITAAAQRGAVFSTTPRKFHVVAIRPEGRRTVVFTSPSSTEAQSAADEHRRFALVTGADVSITVEHDGVHVVGVRR